MYYFTHDQLLPKNTVLQIDDDTGTLSLVQAGECVIQQQFTEPEFLLLNLFFRESGVHCTYEEALAECINEPLVVCQERLHAARLKDEQEESLTREAFSVEIQPVRTVLHECRERLRTFGLDIAALLHYGYVLFQYNK